MRKNELAGTLSRLGKNKDDTKESEEILRSRKAFENEVPAPIDIQNITTDQQKDKEIKG